MILLGAPVFLVATLIGAAIEKPEEWTVIYRSPWDVVLEAAGIFSTDNETSPEISGLVGIG